MRTNAIRFYGYLVGILVWSGRCTGPPARTAIYVQYAVFKKTLRTTGGVRLRLRISADRPAGVSVLRPSKILLCNTLSNKNFKRTLGKIVKSLNKPDDEVHIGY